VANAPATELKQIKLSALTRSNFALMESKQNIFRAIIPRGTPRERITQPDFWSTCAELMHAYDLVWCIGEDRSFIAQYVCLEAGRGYASLHELSFTPLPALLVTSDGLPPGHSIQYLGADQLYGVLRSCDGVVMQTGFTNKQLALDWLLAHASLK